MRHSPGGYPISRTSLRLLRSWTIGIMVFPGRLLFGLIGKASYYDSGTRLYGLQSEN